MSDGVAVATYTPETLIASTQRLGITAEQKIRQAEAQVAPGTHMSLTLTLQPLTIPLVHETVDVSQWVADAINAGWQAGHLVHNGQRMPLWPGQSVPATVDAAQHTVTVRWVSGILWGAVVVGFIVALALTDVIDPLLAVAAIIIYEMVTHWQLVQWVIQKAITLPVGGGPLDIWIGLGILGVALALVAKSS